MSRCRGVVVATGHMIDVPGRDRARFPPASEARVTAEVRDALAAWGVGPGWLVICGGARGADLIVAEEALAAGAATELHLPAPPDVFVRESVTLPDSRWDERFEVVRRASTVHAPDDPDVEGDERYARVNRAMLARALAVAAPDAVRGLAVWDGEPGDGPGGAADLARELVTLLEPGPDHLRIIDPRPPKP